MDNWNNPLLARQRILSAQESTRKVAQKRQEEAAESYKAYREFFSRLALLAGGTIALSVTYLGYLKTLNSAPKDTGLLVASWITLMACVVSGTFQNFFHIAYMGYARGREYAQRLKEQHETVADEVPQVHIVDIESKDDLDTYVANLRDAAAARGKDVKRLHIREKVFNFLFTGCGWIACGTFVLGLVLLLLFALTNIHTPIKR